MGTWAQRERQWAGEGVFRGAESKDGQVGRWCPEKVGIFIVIP